MSEEIKSVITCDLDGKLETFSEGSEALFGYSPDDVIGKEISAKLRNGVLEIALPRQAEIKSKAQKITIK